jgi:hypothetical protein
MSPAELLKFYLEHTVAAGRAKEGRDCVVSVPAVFVAVLVMTGGGVVLVSSKSARREDSLPVPQGPDERVSLAYAVVVVLLVTLVWRSA